MPKEDGSLTQEEYESLAPSDKAHYDVKGRLGDGLDPEDTEATRVARAVAFGDDVEAAREGASAPADDDVVFDGITPADGSGHPQTTEEAVAAEQDRRDKMSEVELEEAEARDALASDTEGGSDAANDAEVPNLGATDPEKE